MPLLDGKIAIVTGAGRGIGRGHALHLAANGAKVIVNDIDLEAADAVVAEVRGQGGEAAASAANIGSRDGAEALVECCAATYGGVDALINNAGNLRDRTLLKMTDEEFDGVWQVHVKGTFWCTQIAARRMVAQGRGGAIVNTVSGAHFGSYGQTNYAAAKGAIASMTYSWAFELARHGIRVNAIGPLGSTQMSATYRSADGSKAQEFDPTANGPMVVFLVSDEADYVSGQIFGTGGERISHMVQPHYGKTLIQPGGWDVDSIRRHFRNQMPGQFGAFGILGQPYPFHAGVRPPAPDEGDA